MKVKVPNSNFTGTSHGLKFVDGVSEDFKDKELMGRLKRKGYVGVVNKRKLIRSQLKVVKGEHKLSLSYSRFRVLS